MRRVKCDEGKPACLKCSITGRQGCTYEHETSRGLLRQRSQDLESIISHTISFDIQGDAQERRAFSFFRSKTALEISGYFPSYFWETLILQASHADPAILHIVVALGSLHEVYQEAQPGLLESSELATKREFAIEQSNKAMSLLRTHISNAAPRSGETVLIACLLFICLETFQGNHKSALTHLDSGLRVLQQWLRDEEPNFCREMSITKPSRTFVESSLIPIFARLDLQASAHIVSRPLHCDLVLKSMDIKDVPEMPEAFSTVYEAADAMLGLVYHMFHVQQVAHGYYDPTRDGSPYNCPEGLVMMFLEAREQNREALDAWLAALNKLLTGSNSKSNMSTRELRATVVLKMHYLFLTIMVGASGHNDETKFDNFTTEFGQMLNMAARLLGPLNTAEQSRQRRIYVFDANLIVPLYAGATRCRDPKLRRKALDLLCNFKSREGIWDSEVAAAIGKWVIEKEEEGLGTIEGAHSIPIERRIRLFGKGTVCGERRVLVKYQQGPVIPGNKTEEEYLTWSNENGLQHGLRESEPEDFWHRL